MADQLSNGEQILAINGVDLCVETFGNAEHPAILLVHGAAASMLWWDAELCERIAAHDRFVIRYDNRDTGRSTSYPPGQPGYSLTDLVGDAVGILDALNVGRAHVVGQSMFGGIVLAFGVDHPDRVASLMFVCTSTGDAGLPPSLPLNVPPAPDYRDPAAVVDFTVGSTKAYAGDSPLFDEPAMRTLVEHDVARATNIESTLTNHYAMDIDGPTGGSFGDIDAPTLVVHGDHDPVFPLAHGEALRDAVPGAELVVLTGAGHEVPRALWDVFVPALVRHTS